MSPEAARSVRRLQSFGAWVCRKCPAPTGAPVSSGAVELEFAAVLDEAYLDLLENLPITEVREMRRLCHDLETDVSYLRRLVQGRIDIASTELTRRREGGDPGDLRELIDRLPEVLAERTRGPASGRLSTSLAPGDLRGELAGELVAIDNEARLTEIDTVSDDELGRIGERLADLERRVSDVRRALFSRIDTLGGELARRYRSGEASLGDLLRRAE